MSMEADVAHWRTWIGRKETRTEALDPEAARRFAAAIGEDLDVEAAPPSLMHWAFFLPVPTADGIGPDGHSKRGGFQPPITLARRMFAAAEMQFLAPLRLGQEAQCDAVIADVKHRAGKSGDLIFVEVDRKITQDGAEKVRERQTIVYRDAGEPAAPIEDKAIAPAAGEEGWRPSTVDLFRFSAATFNSHRIHYDLPYAQEEEFYPGLVVHGPFIAAKLFGYARRCAGKPLSAFSFRALAPAFAGPALRLAPGEGGRGVAALRADGAVAMRAEFAL
ncbi:MAG: MaoC family dehydratase N-terminal domain-containing protein [Terricaulis sp.]|nr:MaoC family dehydratase N-terminal domain-containing protein [Terricaulis sp.]